MFLPLIYHIIFLTKTLFFSFLQLFLILQMFFLKFRPFSFMKPSQNHIFLKNAKLDSLGKTGKNYITLHISEKMKKKKKVRLLSQLMCKRENVMVLTKRSLAAKENCTPFGLNFEHYNKKYNDFYNDLPIGFKQIYFNSKNKNEENQKKIKEPFSAKNKVKILSSTDIRLHDYNDLNGIFSNYCLNDKNRYENEVFSSYLIEKFGKNMSFIEIYDMYYKRRCVDRKCGCTNKSLMRISSFPFLKKKSLESRNFLEIKLTPILENIEYI